MRVSLKYLLFLIFVSAYCSLMAQSAINPFELKHRAPNSPANPFNIAKPKQESADSSLRERNPFQKQISTNPFDLLESSPKRTSVDENFFPDPAIKPINRPENPGFLFWFLLSVLLFFTAIISISRKRLEQVYHAFLNDNMLRQIHRTNKGMVSISYFLLYLLFFVNLGLFIFLSAGQFGLVFSRHFTFLLLLISGIGLVFIAKHLLLFLVGKIFPIEKEIKLYNFTIMVFGIILGLLLLPSNLLITYAPPEIARIGVYVAVGAILAIYLFRSLRGLAIGSRYLMLHKFHFLLYLCAVEILPVIVLLKIILLRIN